MKIRTPAELEILKSVRMRSHHDAIAPLRRLKSHQEDLSQTLQRRSFGKEGVIYVHVPFCQSGCTFCNLRKKPGIPPDWYGDLLVEQVMMYAGTRYVSDSTFSAVYFGGGTPTLLSEQAIRKVLTAIRTNLPLSKNVEITFETTVSALTEDKASVLQEEGVNRLSIGVQTFSDKGRETLGRKGTGEHAANFVKRLLVKGFDNVGIDLIYNYPGQSEADLNEDLGIIAELNIAGFSFYSLITREGTPIARLAEGEQVYPPQNTRERLFFDQITDRCLGGAFSFLELTKLVRHERDRYNYVRIRYSGGDTLPIGAGAGGRLGQLSIMNPVDIHKYRDFVGLQEDVRGHVLDEGYDAIYKLIGQVQFGALDLRSLDEDFPHREVLPRFCRQLVEDKLLTVDGEKYRLTNDGIYWGNNIAARLAEILVQAVLQGPDNGYRISP